MSHGNSGNGPLDAAPFWCARPHAANNIPAVFRFGHRRLRRRGSRSLRAILQRSHKRSRGTPSGIAAGEPAALMPEDNIDLQHINIYSINIRCLLAHKAELCHYLVVHAPHIVFLQETWLNKSIEEVALPNYSKLSRHDRFFKQIKLCR